MSSYLYVFGCKGRLKSSALLWLNGQTWFCAEALKKKEEKKVRINMGQWEMNSVSVRDWEKGGAVWDNTDWGHYPVISHELTLVITHSSALISGCHFGDLVRFCRCCTPLKTLLRLNPDIFNLTRVFAQFASGAYSTLRFICFQFNHVYDLLVHCGNSSVYLIQLCGEQI